MDNPFLQQQVKRDNASRIAKRCDLVWHSAADPEGHRCSRDKGHGGNHMCNCGATHKVHPSRRKRK